MYQTKEIIGNKQFELSEFPSLYKKTLNIKNIIKIIYPEMCFKWYRLIEVTAKQQ